MRREKGIWMNQFTPDTYRRSDETDEDCLKAWPREDVNITFEDVIIRVATITRKKKDA